MNQIEIKRNKIDEIDHQINNLLTQRFQITNAIGAVKFKQDCSVRNKQREQEILTTIKRKHKELDSKLVDEIYATIFKYSVKQQKKIYN